jgi:ATP-dependent Lon protease
MITVQLLCDFCRRGVVWGKHASQTEVGSWALENGWVIGNEHICPECCKSHKLNDGQIKELHDRLMKIYKKYYRTQHARLIAKTKRISRSQLNIWTEKASQARVLVENQIYSVEEFIKYLDGEDSEITKVLGELKWD